MAAGDGGKGSDRRPGVIPPGAWEAIDWGKKGGTPPAPKPLMQCASSSDGDCVHAQCPQLRDNEPKQSGRSCPLFDWNDRRD